MSRLIRILILIVFLYPVSLFSQYFIIDTIKGQSPFNKNVSYIFPHIVSSGNQATTDLINEYLVGDMLEIDSGERYKSIFEKVWGDSESVMPSLTNISYDEINNDTDFFCISITAEGCAAYCESFTRYYTWESKTGVEITLDTLFSKEGLQKIIELVKDSKNRRISKTVNSLKSALKDKNTKDDDREYDTIAIYGFDDCLALGVNAEYLKYSMDRKYLSIYTESCLPHMIRGLDEVDYTFTFDITEVKKYLSAYGKSLLKL